MSDYTRYQILYNRLRRPMSSLTNCKNRNDLSEPLWLASNYLTITRVRRPALEYWRDLAVRLSCRSLRRICESTKLNNSPLYKTIELINGT